MIRKSIRTLLLGAAALAALGFLLFGRAFPSYVGTAVDSARASVADAVPVELEIRRAEGLIVQIDPQIEVCKRDLARAEVELDELRASVVRLDKAVVQEERALRAGATRLRAEPAGVLLAADAGERRRAEAALARRKDGYVNDAAMLKTKRSLIERQEQAVAAARDRLDAVRLERADLDGQLQSLRTQKLQLEALAAASRRFELDDSALGRAKEALAGVKKRLDVAQRVLENDLTFHGEPAGEPQAARDVVKEIDALFGAGASAEATAAVEVAAAGGDAGGR